jgi:hypothetical protein
LNRLDLLFIVPLLLALFVYEFVSLLKSKKIK